jgi:hypothetical protein
MTIVLKRWPWYLKLNMLACHTSVVMLNTFFSICCYYNNYFVNDLIMDITVIYTSDIIFFRYELRPHLWIWHIQ